MTNETALDLAKRHAQNINGDPVDCALAHASGHLGGALLHAMSGAREQVADAIHLAQNSIDAAVILRGEQARAKLDAAATRRFVSLWKRSR